MDPTKELRRSLSEQGGSDAHDRSAFGDGSSPRSPRLLQDADLTRSCALFVGSEGTGLPRELISQIDEFVAIPQVRVESLNAAVAGSIALYEAQRQRSIKP